MCGMCAWAAAVVLVLVLLLPADADTGQHRSRPSQRTGGEEHRSYGRSASPDRADGYDHDNDAEYNHARDHEEEDDHDHDHDPDYDHDHDPDYGLDYDYGHGAYDYDREEQEHDRHDADSDGHERGGEEEDVAAVSANSDTMFGTNVICTKACVAHADVYGVCRRVLACTRADMCVCVRRTGSARGAERICTKACTGHVRPRTRKIPKRTALASCLGTGNARSREYLLTDDAHG